MPVWKKFKDILDPNSEKRIIHLESCSHEVSHKHEMTDHKCRKSTRVFNPLIFNPALEEPKEMIILDASSKTRLFTKKIGI